MSLRRPFPAWLGSVAAILIVSSGLSGTALGATTPAGFSSIPIQGVSLTGNSPGMLWYQPVNVALMTQKVQAWLAAATVVPAPAMPRKQPVLMDYLGPARLSFTDGANGEKVAVFPAYYLAEEGKAGAVTVHYIPDTVAYQSGPGGPAVYLREPALDRYLRQGRLWQRDFVPEEFTPADKAAVQAIRSSRWGGTFAGFPVTPGERVATLREGAQTVYETRTTSVRTEGTRFTVTFEETWADGHVLREWNFAVSSEDGVEPVGETVQCSGGNNTRDACPLEAAGEGLPGGVTG